ncbi:MAG: hypothetical protein LBD24_06830 [Spirochaetaceae bacterium]|nr:hypothetical protein [Spirochaetaceae bacterium]
MPVLYGGPDTGFRLRAEHGARRCCRLAASGCFISFLPRAPNHAVSDDSISGLRSAANHSPQRSVSKALETARERSRALTALTCSTDRVLHYSQTTSGHAEAVGDGVALLSNNRRPC